MPIFTKNYKYSNMNDVMYGKLDKNYLNEIKNNIYMKYRISRLILENNYYNYLFND